MVSRITFIQHLDCELKNSQLPVKSHIEALTKMNSHNCFWPIIMMLCAAGGQHSSAL